MDSRPEEIIEEIHKLLADMKRFWAQTDANSYSVTELIELFLKSTGSTIPEDELLSFFAQDCYSRLGWSGTCQVYEYINANEQYPSIYESWTQFGTTLMKDTQNLSFDERVRVAADVEAIFERDAKESGDYSELNMAYFYYDHPLKAEQPQFYLLKSKEWFERAIESDECNQSDHHVLQTLGHVFFELGDVKSALHWYKKFEAVGNYCGDACVLDHALTEKRLVECQERTTEQGS